MPCVGLWGGLRHNDRTPVRAMLVAIFAATLLFAGAVDAKGSGGHSGGGHSSSHLSGGHASNHSWSHSSSRGSAGGSHAHSGSGTSRSSTRAVHPHAVTGHIPTSKRAAQGAARDSHGRIARSEKAKDDFKHSHPCPSTGKRSGACPGYVIDHVQALKHGGADRPSNMQWEMVQQAKIKDRTE
jgi:hypothetical protein